MTDDSTTLLSMREVRRTFRNGDGVGSSDVVALGGIDFDLHPAEMVALTGRSGSGKSTLLRLAAGLDDPDSGNITLAGRSMTGMKATERAELRRQYVGIVFQALNLIPTLTAAENVGLPLELGGASVRTAAKQAGQALELVGLSNRGSQFPDQLSGGQRQRVAIARAIVGERRMLLADEPTGALDERSGEEILELLRTLADGGMGVVLVTHDRGLAGLADRVVELRDGRISHSVERRDLELEFSELWR